MRHGAHHISRGDDDPILAICEDGDLRVANDVGTHLRLRALGAFGENGKNETFSGDDNRRRTNLLVSLARGIEKDCRPRRPVIIEKTDG
jgi:hypothetical protein